MLCLDCSGLRAFSWLALFGGSSPCLLDDDNFDSRGAAGSRLLSGLEDWIRSTVLCIGFDDLEELIVYRLVLAVFVDVAKVDRPLFVVAELEQHEAPSRLSASLVASRILPEDR